MVLEYCVVERGKEIFKICNQYPALLIVFYGAECLEGKVDIASVQIGTVRDCDFVDTERRCLGVVDII